MATPEPLTPEELAYLRDDPMMVHTFDAYRIVAALRAATPDPAEPGLREAVAAHVACVCEQLTGEGPRPLGSGRVYHFQGCCADSDLAADVMVRAVTGRPRS
jgi:hypothetical protein